jgi:hypothetical protein
MVLIIIFQRIKKNSFCKNTYLLIAGSDIEKNDVKFGVGLTVNQKMEGKEWIGI